MSLDLLFDHTAEITHVDASTPVTVDAYGDSAPDPDVTPVAERCAVVPPKLALRDYGAGDVSVGRMDAYFRMGVLVAARDVVKLTTGPEAPSTWIVDSVSHPRGHHVEVSLIPWSGTP